VKATNKPTAPVPPLRVQTQDLSELWARCNTEKGEIFAAHLSKVFTTNENHPDITAKYCPNNNTQSERDQGRNLLLKYQKSTWYRQNHTPNHK
jgi:hypothetical protein